MKSIKHSLFISFSLLFSTSALAEATADNGAHQSLDEVHEQALTFLKQKIDQKLLEPKIRLKKLNPRVQLPRCQTPLELIDRTPTKLAGRTTLGVKCHQPNWQTFISAHIDGKLPVVVSTQGILKRVVIKPSHVTLKNVHYKSVPSDALISIENVLGMRTKKTISPNSVITLRSLQPPYMVLKNQPVSILTKIGEVEIHAKGVALEDGVENQRVDIKNISSQKTIKGIVIAPNTVVVP